MNYFFMDRSALAKRYVAETGTPLVDQLFTHVQPGGAKATTWW